MKKKIVICALSIAVIICCAVGGTFAWLTTQTGEVRNTFTIGNIDITLAETTSAFKMIPGETIAKDPVVTVKANSEACWLFVKVTESDNLDDFITYTVDSGWTALTGVSGVYYREVAAVSADTSFDVLTGNAVTVKDTVTKTMMDALTENTLPTLTFKAYAVQKAGSASATEAWAKVSA